MPSAYLKIQKKSLTMRSRQSFLISFQQSTYQKHLLHQNNIQAPADILSNLNSNTSSGPACSRHARKGRQNDHYNLQKRLLDIYSINTNKTKRNLINGAAGH